MLKKRKNNESKKRKIWKEKVEGKKTDIENMKENEKN